MCTNCKYCSVNPSRLPNEVFEQLNFIPVPLLDHTKENYKIFDEVYGSVLNEKDGHKYEIFK